MTYFTLKNIIILTKPIITFTAVISTYIGIALSEHKTSLYEICIIIISILLLVSGSNTLNMYYERKYDKLMLRTKNRPIPNGNIKPKIALNLGFALIFISFVMLLLHQKHITLILGIISFIIYIYIYTPLKRLSHLAVFIGAIPGAMPPLMGYISASNGSISNTGIMLFFILFLWQIPHFLAIGIFRGYEYKKAGYPMLIYKFNIKTIKIIILFTTLCLIICSINIWTLNTTGLIYKIISTIIGTWFIVICMYGFFTNQHNKWAKQIFIISIKYQLILFSALIIDIYI